MLYVINRFFFDEVSFSILSLEHSFLQMHKRTTGMRNSEVRLLIIALKQMFVFFNIFMARLKKNCFHTAYTFPRYDIYLKVIGQKTHLNSYHFEDGIKISREVQSPG